MPKLDTTQYNFDTIPNRRGSDSMKWSRYDEDVLPLWVADMDFASPQPVLRALHERVDHAIFGYAEKNKGRPEELRQTVTMDEIEHARKALKPKPKKVKKEEEAAVATS